jgi:hypothetical protein
MVLGMDCFIGLHRVVGFSAVFTISSDISCLRVGNILDGWECCKGKEVG